MKKENQTIIQKDKGKQALLLLGCVAFIFGCFYIINPNLRSSIYSHEFLMVVGIIGILLFGLIGISIIVSFMKYSPALIINEKGIRNYSHAGSGYLIDWDNIQSMNIMTVSRKKMIVFKLKDYQKITKQVNVFSRTLMKLNGGFSGSPVFVTNAMINMKIEDILIILQQKKKELGKSIF